MRSPTSRWSGCAHLCWATTRGRTIATCRSPISSTSCSPRGGRDLVRGRQPAPRARVDAVRAHQAARRQGAHPRRHRIQVELHRAPGTGGAAHRTPRAADRARERHRRQRLRLWHLGGTGRGRPRRGLWRSRCACRSARLASREFWRSEHDPESGDRFSEKIMLQQQERGDEVIRSQRGSMPPRTERSGIGVLPSIAARDPDHLQIGASAEAQPLHHG